MNTNSNTVMHPILGSFEPIEDLLYHDCPYVFTFRDAQGELAIAYLAGMDEKSSHYLAARITENELAEIKSGALPLQRVFRAGALDIRLDASAAVVSVTEKSARELDPKDLPPADLTI
jgi:hypothetical protein